VTGTLPGAAARSSFLDRNRAGSLLLVSTQKAKILMIIPNGA
jgi:hypothetical protein